MNTKDPIESFKQRSVSQEDIAHLLTDLQGFGDAVLSRIEKAKAKGHSEAAFSASSLGIQPLLMKQLKTAGFKLYEGGILGQHSIAVCWGEKPPGGSWEEIFTGSGT